MHDPLVCRRPLLLALAAVLTLALVVTSRAPARADAMSAIIPGIAQPIFTTFPATSPNGLPPTYAAPMVYDLAHRSLYLFNHAESWGWDGRNWIQFVPSTTAPSALSQTMAYDTATQTAVLFGGTPNPTTWTWDGATWTLQHPTTSPPARSWAAMAYDAKHQQVVLFGGIPWESGALANDTWTWDGKTWTEQHPVTAPSARAAEVMAYDAAVGAVVLFGGLSGNNHDLNDMWLWDGTTWTLEPANLTPQGRQQASLAYDNARQQLVLFGGFAYRPHSVEGTTYGDTWTWNGSAWTQVASQQAPSPRVSASMAYDIAAARVILVGGSYLRDTWIWNGEAWNRPPQ